MAVYGRAATSGGLDDDQAKRPQTARRRGEDEAVAADRKRRRSRPSVEFRKNLANAHGAPHQAQRKRDRGNHEAFQRQPRTPAASLPRGRPPASHHSPARRLRALSPRSCSQLSEGRTLQSSSAPGLPSSSGSSVSCPSTSLKGGRRGEPAARGSASSDEESLE
jgi:hypothetical protein